MKKLAKVLLVRIVGALCDEGIIRQQGFFAGSLVVQRFDKVIVVLQVRVLREKVGVWCDERVVRL